MTDHARSAATIEQLRAAAFTERSQGNFLYAADLFRQASRLSDDPASSLNSQMRRVYCLVAAEQREQAVSIAERVVQRARAEGIHTELVDALALLVDHHHDLGHIAIAVQLLAEATWLMEQMPDAQVPHLVLHNLADTYAHCGFHAEAITLFRRAVHIAPSEHDRLFAAANLTASYHIAGISEFDLDERRRLLEEGLAVAASVLEGESSELEADVLCRAHRAAMLAHTGRYDEALRDADAARAKAAVHAMRDEELVAMSAQCIARWRGQHDRTVLQLVVDGQRLAEETASAALSGVFADLRSEILWSTARHDEARDVMVAHIADLRGSVRRHMAARWAHVRQAIDARRSELLHDTDPLTGLGNETFLHGFLDQELGRGSPVCIAVIDLDQFRDLNDTHGYPEGDRVLQEVARVLERVSRRGDTVVRLGGDEFAMVLRDISVGDARHVLERVRQLIAARRWEGLPDIELTVSIGLTVGADVEDAAVLLAVARDALHDAKRDGRNRIAHR